ncbi:DUF4333 domain-containing protein [Nocardia sp. NBC_01503]|uniref:DUF4333 domain-containing protein n=1 Tax=Nocardia sp. NBC_01503 TaxID=2975997 RepID=UPI002E7AF065|nr:DUF4333 domain-containing protein [Nocardia sp. NBC_01503]WTL31570.1 DUF4333 domain-containing protein [Nocardia sp. NBC_01503]
MSGPYGPNDAPGTGEGRNDPTQQWGGGQPQPGSAGPNWGGQQPAQPTANWGDQQQPWAQSQPQQPQPGQQWGQSQPQWPQQGQPATGGQEWGQQPQPGQQWAGSQPQWPQQGQPGQPGWDQQQPGGQQWPQPQTPKKKTGLIIGIVAAVVVVLGAIVAGVVVLTAKDQLDNKAVATGVQKVLKDSYGIEDVQDVNCPSGQKVEVDKTFDCTLKVGGEAKKVTIKVTKDDGTYEVGRPS